MGGIRGYNHEIPAGTSDASRQTSNRCNSYSNHIGEVYPTQWSSGADCGQINMQYISPGLSCRATEIVPLIDISDVYNVSMGMDPQEFIIRRNRHGATTYFASKHRELIVKVCVMELLSRCDSLSFRVFDLPKDA